MVRTSSHMDKIKAIHGSILLIPIGIAINYGLSQLVLSLGIPLFLDSLGTVLTTLLGGIIPGMFVGFLLNALNGVSDPITLYYGIISILLASATGLLARHGWFNSVKRSWLPVLVLAAIGGAIGSCLTWLLYGRGIGTGISAPFANQLVLLGLPAFFAQLTADMVIDLADKLIVVLLAIWILKIIPQRMIDSLPYRLVARTENQDSHNYRICSLRTKVSIILIINALLLGGAVTMVDAISYRKDLIPLCTDPGTGIINMALLNHDLMIFVIKHLSLMFGIALVVAMLVLLYCDIRFVAPINHMTNIADMFAFYDDEKKRAAEQLMGEVTLHTGDELESLFISMKKMFSDTNAYIAHIQEDMDYITRLQDGMILSFASMVESRDLSTGVHIKRTASYVKIIAAVLFQEGKYPEILSERYISELVRSAPLHDIGKITIPDSILNKPGKLTAEEFECMKAHTTSGEKILSRVMENIGESEYLSIAAQMAVGHHEWWNGSGYPYGLKGEQIPLAARIMAVADVYDALLSKRSYKEVFSQEAAFAIILKESGTHFDPSVVEALLSAKEEILKVI